MTSKSIEIDYTLAEDILDDHIIYRLFHNLDSDERKYIYAIFYQGKAYCMKGIRAFFDVYESNTNESIDDLFFASEFCKEIIVPYTNMTDIDKFTDYTWVYFERSVPAHFDMIVQNWKIGCIMANLCEKDAYRLDVSRIYQVSVTTEEGTKEYTINIPDASFS